MVIKNNFNSKDTNPLKDYQQIGKGRNNFENQEHVPNQVIQDILDKDKEYLEDDEDRKDNWDFFR